MLWFFVSFKNFFSDNTRVRILFFLSGKVRNFFPEFNIRLYGCMTKTVNQIIFFSSTTIRIFFSATLGIRIFFQKKTITPPLQVKWSVPKMPHIFTIVYCCYIMISGMIFFPSDFTDFSYFPLLKKFRKLQNTVRTVRKCLQMDLLKGGVDGYSYFR